MKTALSQLAQRTEVPPISWLMDLRLSRTELISLAAGFTNSTEISLWPRAALVFKSPHHECDASDDDDGF
ncbi:MAG: hypothetical protein HY300_19125 [Verrucomicrobia bacterium]|nr:hypothetical protein [Verrucomicrobiota bacterium]